MTKVTVRIRRTLKSGQIVELNKKFFPEAPLSEDGLDNSLWWIAESQGDVVGFCGLYVGIRGQVWLLRVAVDREYRKLGLGKRLLTVRMKEWRKNYPDCEVYTYVQESNVASSKNLIWAGLCPYKVESAQWLYFWRPALNRP